MPTITLAQITDAVEVTLRTATGLARSESYNKLTEGAQDLPMLQVYPQAGNTADFGANDRTTFTAARRIANYTIYADLYARQRSHIDEDMAKLVNMIEAIETRLQAQTTGNPFGLAGIKSFRWSWERVVFQYAGVDYYGARFIITIWAF